MLDFIWNLILKAPELSPFVTALLSIAGALTALFFIRADNEFYLVRPHGMTKIAAYSLRLGLVTMAILSIGFAAITLTKEPLSETVSTGIPAGVAALTALMILYQIVNRPTFTWRRFWVAAGLPLTAPLIPFGGYLLPTIPV